MVVIEKKKPELAQSPPTMVNLEFLRTGAQFEGQSPSLTRKLTTQAQAAAADETRVRSNSQRLNQFYEATQQAMEAAAQRGYRPPKRASSKPSSDDGSVNVSFLKSGLQFVPSSGADAPEPQDLSRNRRLDRFQMRMQRAVEDAVARGYRPTAVKDAAKRGFRLPAHSKASTQALASDQDTSTTTSVNVTFLKSGLQFVSSAVRSSPEPEPRDLSRNRRLDRFQLQMQRAVEDAVARGYSPATPK